MQAKVRNALKLYRRPTTSATIEMRLHRAVLYNPIYHSDDQLLVGQHAFSLQAPTLVKKFDEAVRSVADGEDDADSRDELLRRVDHVSKGRFAQRLAGHLDDIAPEPFQREIVDCLPAGQRAVGEPSKTAAELMALGSYGYLMAALDRISWQVRGRGLLPSPSADAPQSA